MFNKQLTRVAFLVCFCCLYMYCSVVKADTVRHVSYGGDCLTGKINCDGWVITIMKDSTPIQQVTLTRDTKDLPIHYDYENVKAATVLEVEGFFAALAAGGAAAGAAAAGGGAAAVAAAAVGLAGGVGMGAVLAGNYFNHHNEICITDPDGLKQFEGNPECYELSHAYINHVGETGNVKLNYPADGDITINGATWQEKKLV